MSAGNRPCCVCVCVCKILWLRATNLSTVFFLHLVCVIWIHLLLFNLMSQVSSYMSVQQPYLTWVIQTLLPVSLTHSFSADFSLQTSERYIGVECVLSCFVSYSLLQVGQGGGPFVQTRTLSVPPSLCFAVDIEWQYDRRWRPATHVWDIWDRQTRSLHYHKLA